MLSGAHGWQKGRRSGGSCSRQSLSWRAPISSIPKPAVTKFMVKSPDANPGDQMIRDRRRISEACFRLSRQRMKPSGSHFLASQRLRSGNSLPEHARWSKWSRSWRRPARPQGRCVWRHPYSPRRRDHAPRQLCAELFLA